MFYSVTLQKMVTIAPKNLGRTLHRHLLNYLRDAVEGKPMQTADALAFLVAEATTAEKSSAIVLCVIDILHAEALQGKVLDDGNVAFLLTYNALVLKLHRGEVISVLVERVGQDGWWGNVCGVGMIFISQSQMSADLARPDWAYENSEGDGMWMSTDSTRSIKVNDLVRVRVLAETPQSQGAIAIGTMLGPYLGPT